MSQIICVADVNDPKKVIAAFQQAADVVLNPQSLQRMIGNSQDPNFQQDYSYQHIHPSPTQPAVGQVSLVVGGYGETQDSSSIFVTFYLPGHHGGRDNVYVPSQVIERLGVRLGGISSVHLFKFNRLNRQADVHIMLPTQTFVRHPRVLIVTK